MTNLMHESQADVDAEDCRSVARSIMNDVTQSAANRLLAAEMLLRLNRPREESVGEERAKR